MTAPAGPPRAVAVIGTGVIGRSWIRVFARAGYETRVWDPDPVQVESAWEWMKAELKRARREHGLRKRVARSEREQVVRCETIEEALAGAKLYDLPENRVFMGTKQKPGPLYQTVKDAIEFWRAQGKLVWKDVTPEDVLDPSLLE